MRFAGIALWIILHASFIFGTNYQHEKQVEEKLLRSVFCVSAYLDKNLQSTGTGFIIGQSDTHYYVATAGHLFTRINPEDTKCFLDNKFQQRISAKIKHYVLDNQENKDFAILEIEKTTVLSPFEFSSLPVQYGKITIIGASYSDLPAKTHHRIKWKDYYKKYFFVWPRVKVGMSGGPALNQENKVVGIVIATSRTSGIIFSYQNMKECLKEWDLKLE